MTHELVLERTLDAPRDKVWRCWTEPQLLQQWFAPTPWTVSDATLDVRPGGVTAFTMRGPEGQAFPNAGVYLDVVPGERIVTTDAYTRAWEPSERPFMTATVTFEDAPGGKTRYRAVASHWNAEDKAAHEAMGFHEGWGQCADQLEALAKTL